MRVTPAGPDMARINYVCRPSTADMRLPLCTSKALGSAAVHAIFLATDVVGLRSERDRSAHAASMPAHIRQYVGAAA